MTICVGFDPGGEKNFGWAVLDFSQGKVRLIGYGTCSGADAAVEAAKSLVGDRARAVAVDAPLFWVPSGDRYVDSRIRRMVCDAGGSGGTVGSVNSLRGACLVQGVIAAKLALRAWRDAQLTEAHPKALLRVCSAAQLFVDQIETGNLSDHVIDAALAAFSAHALFVRMTGWTDLAKFEKSCIWPVGRKVSYFFPDGET